MSFGAIVSFGATLTLGTVATSGATSALDLLSEHDNWPKWFVDGINHLQSILKCVHTIKLFSLPWLIMEFVDCLLTMALLIRNYLVLKARRSA